MTPKTAITADHRHVVVREGRRLRRMLNEWDFIGVADLVDDEYDCLIRPLVSRLTKGATRDEITAFGISSST
jgi:hypothetical protein